MRSRKNFLEIKGKEETTIMPKEMNSFRKRTEHNGQAKKGTGRMPWHWEPMKDVVSCEKLRGAANEQRSGDI